MPGWDPKINTPLPPLNKLYPSLTHPQKRTSTASCISLLPTLTVSKASLSSKGDTVRPLGGGEGEPAGAGSVAEEGWGVPGGAARALKMLDSALSTCGVG